MRMIHPQIIIQTLLWQYYILATLRIIREHPIQTPNTMPRSKPSQAHIPSRLWIQCARTVPSCTWHWPSCPAAPGGWWTPPLSWTPGIYTPDYRGTQQRVSDDITQLQYVHTTRVSDRMHADCCTHNARTKTNTWTLHDLGNAQDTPVPVSGPTVFKITSQKWDIRVRCSFANINSTSTSNSSSSVATLTTEQTYDTPITC